MSNTTTPAPNTTYVVAKGHRVGGGVDRKGRIIPSYGEGETFTAEQALRAGHDINPWVAAGIVSEVPKSKSDAGKADTGK